MADKATRGKCHLLRVLLLTRLALALQGNAEITHAAMSRIVRHEQQTPNALVQIGARNDPMELEPNILGSGGESTTEIVASGEGPTTTAIFAVGSSPEVGEAPNAIDLTPAPFTLMPGMPGPPGPPGPPGSPGDPGPPEGETLAPTTTERSYQMGAGAGTVTAAPLGADTQSGYEIRGGPGGPGSAGPRGKRGAKGTIGLEGIMGPRGERGPPGPRGERGVEGKSMKANAPPMNWFWYAVGINAGITLLVFIISYCQFAARKSPKGQDWGEESWGEEQWGAYAQQPQ